MKAPPKAKKLTCKKSPVKPADVADGVEEKKIDPILEAFGKVYMIFLAEQRAKLEVLKAQFPDDPAAAEYFDNSFKAVFYNEKITKVLFSHWISYGVLPKAKQGEKISADRLRGTKTTKEKSVIRKAAFRAIFLEEQEMHGKKHTKEGVIDSARTRFEAEHCKISKRTAWDYVKDLT